MDRASAFGNIFPRDSGIAEGSGFESQVGRLFYFHGVSLHSTEQLNVVCYGAIFCPRHSYLTPFSLHSTALPSQSFISCSPEGHTYIEPQWHRYKDTVDDLTIRQSDAGRPRQVCPSYAQSQWSLSLQYTYVVYDRRWQRALIDLTSYDITVWYFFVSYFRLRAISMQNTLCYQEN